MKVAIIVALDRANGIGRDNALLCRIPEDLQFFKQTTMGHHLIMGRLTYESIGRPLPGRTSVVLTTKGRGELPQGVLVAQSLPEALAICRARGQEKVFITGGGKVYAEAIGIADEIIATRIDAAFDADTHFPPIDGQVWSLHSEEPWLESRKGLKYRLERYFRKVK